MLLVLDSVERRAFIVTVLRFVLLGNTAVAQAVLLSAENSLKSWGGLNLTQYFKKLCSVTNKDQAQLCLYSDCLWVGEPDSRVYIPEKEENFIPL